MATPLYDEVWAGGRKEPDLQKLERRHGGYHKITAEAWERYDRQMAEWLACLRAGDYEAEKERGG